MSKRQAWIQALRTNRYPQAHGQMVSFKGQNCYCALGVAAKVCGVTDHDMTTFVNLGAAIGRSKAQKEFGLDGTTERAVMCLNDNSRLSFPEIADLLEQGNEAVQKAAGFGA